MKNIIKTFEQDDYYAVLKILLAFAAVIILLGIGIRSPWPADEPRFVEVAREMVATGNWLFPMRGGEFYPDKPPVFMWSIALFYSLIGNLKLAFLLPNAICGLITLFLVYDLGAKPHNVRVGRNAALLLLITPQFLIQAKAAQIDAMVMCWITIGCYGFIRHFILGPNWRWYFISWAFMALGIITKGVGFLPVLMFIPIIAYRLANKDYFKGRLTFACWLGFVPFFLVLAAWFVPMMITVAEQATPELIQYKNNILFKQTGERYANAWHHLEPWYYFIVSVIPVMWFPLPILLLSSLKHVYHKLKTDPVLMILFAWVVLVVCFFSISPGKRGVYVLPALPMLSLFTTIAYHEVKLPLWFNRISKSILWLIAIVLVVACIGLLTGHKKLVKPLTAYPEMIPWAAGLAFILAAIWLVSLWRLRSKNAFFNLGMVIVASWLIVSTLGYWLAEPLRTPKHVIEEVENTLGQHGERGELGLVKFKEQFLLFSQLPITHFSYLATDEEEERNAWLWMGEKAGRFILVPDDANLTCFDVSNGQDMGYAHRQHWLLLSAKQMAENCQAPKVIKRFSVPREAY